MSLLGVAKIALSKCLSVGTTSVKYDFEFLEHHKSQPAGVNRTSVCDTLRNGLTSLCQSFKEKRSELRNNPLSTMVYIYAFLMYHHLTHWHYYTLIISQNYATSKTFPFQGKTRTAGATPTPSGLSIHLAPVVEAFPLYLCPPAGVHSFSGSPDCLCCTNAQTWTRQPIL